MIKKIFLKVYVNYFFVQYFYIELEMKFLKIDFSLWK